MSSNNDLSYIDTIGADIYDIFAKDPSQTEWFNQVKDEYNENYQFPDDTVHKIQDYLLSHNTDGSYSSIIEKFNSIAADEDDLENLLGSIFFPNFDDGNDDDNEGGGNEDDFIIPDDYEEEEEDKESPSYYFNRVLNEVSTTLYISDDITYILLKKHGWNKDVSLSNWFSNQDQFFKSVHIKVGSEVVPDLQASLEPKECGTGKCPICQKNGQLYQLYCSHKICKECLDSEVEKQINQGKLPFCHQQTSNHIDCNSEIIIKSSMYPELFDKYKEVLLNDKLSNNSIDVRACPNPHCSYCISPNDRINRYIGRCSHCYTAVCYKCRKESHAPLEDCSKIDEFCNIIPAQMIKLASDQNKWESKECQLKDYRCKNKTEVTKQLNEIYKLTDEQQTKEASDEKKKYNEICSNTPKLNQQIEEIKKNIRESINNPKSAQQIGQYSKQIIDVRQEIDRNELKKREFSETMNTNDAKRKQNLQYIQFDNEILINGLSDPTSYQNSISKFHDTQMSNAYASFDPYKTDSESSLFLSESCPKCKSQVTKFVGINKMQCKCGFNLCKVCLKNWDALHEKHCACPLYMQKISLNSKASNNLNEKKFSPPPMTLKRAMDFILFENYYGMFMRQKEIYEKLKNDYNSNDSKSLRGKLLECFKKQFDHSESESSVTMILNTVLLAKSMVAWSYPTIYFALKEGKIKYANSLIKAYGSLNYNNNQLIDKIENSICHDARIFKNEISMIDNEIKELLEE